MEENKIDENFLYDLKSFFKKNFEYKYSDTETFIEEFEEFIQNKKYDLSCIIQYK